MFRNAVHVYCAGRQVADDIGFDGAGQASTDPAAILQGGAIRPFDRCLRCCRAALGSYILVAPDRALGRQALYYAPDSQPHAGTQAGKCLQISTRATGNFFCKHSCMSRLQTHIRQARWQDSALCGSCRSHKGSHLALIVELLAGPLVVSQAPCDKPHDGKATK